MKYHTINELDHFCFKEAYIAQICAVNGMFEIVFDNVTILPENSCNRDIREMRANELVLKISEPKIEALVEEGYKVYDANGNLKQKNEDITIAPEAYVDKLKELECIPLSRKTEIMLFPLIRRIIPFCFASAVPGIHKSGIVS